MSDAKSRRRPVLIAGPTASGKSALALAIAEQFGGVIINADSMQVYRELRLLSARPTLETEARLPHALYGFMPATDAYSVGRYALDAAAALARARVEGRLPVIVGGTGLYFKALLEGLSPVPQIEDAIRNHWRAESERRGTAELYRELAARDAVMAERLAPTDTQRIVRALEVFDGTGRSLSDWQKLSDPPVLEETETVRLRIFVDRAELHSRIDARFDSMIAGGALDEARKLAELMLDPGLPAMRAIGVRPLLAVLRRSVSLEAGVDAAKLETLQYAKRQETWFKRNMITWNKVYKKQIESYMHKIFAFIQY